MSRYLGKHPKPRPPRRPKKPKVPRNFDGGPFFKETVGASKSEYKMWYRSRIPHVSPLPYIAEKRGGLFEFKSGPSSGQGPLPFGHWMSNEFAFMKGTHTDASGLDREIIRARALCYDRIHKKMQKTASLGTSLVEAKGAIAMIADRARQLLRAVRALKKGDIRAFASNLSLSPNGFQRRVARNLPDLQKDLANVWLEASFGWIPLINDIGDCVEVLQQDFPTEHLRARSAANVSYTFVDEFESLHNSPGSTVDCNVKVEYGCRMKVTNPQLALANELGFVNPASIAWETIPFSFVVDWFLPIGKFIAQTTDELGISVFDAYITITRNALATEKLFISNGDFSVTSGFAASVVREPVGSFPTPGFLDRLNLPTADAWLVVSSLALLTQQLSSLRR